ELLHVRDHEALVSALGDLVLLVPRLNGEEIALAVALEEPGARPHLHADGRGGQVLHLHPGADRSRAGRPMGPQHRPGGVLEHADEERRGEHVEAAVAHGVCRAFRVDDLAHFSRGARCNVHDARFYRGKRSECKPIRTSIASMMPRNTRSLIRSSMRRAAQAPANIVLPSTKPTMTASRVRSE